MKAVYFIASFALLYVLYFMTLLGVFYIDMDYLYNAFLFLHVLICIYLLYKFNPVYRVGFNGETDTPLIFMTVSFLLMYIVGSRASMMFSLPL